MVNLLLSPQVKGKAYSKAEELSDLGDAGDASVLFFRIRRDFSQAGALAGAAVADFFLHLDPRARGRALLSFDGWSSDPRDLWNIPQVVSFCRGFLLKDLGRPDVEHARLVLTYLVDEDKVDSESRFDLAGALWLVSVVFRDECYVEASLRDVGLARQICHWIRDDGPPPKFIQH